MADQSDGCALMTALPRRRRLVVALAMLTAVTVPGPIASAAPIIGQSCPDGSYAGSTAPQQGQSGSRRPIILVHGWTGGAMSGTAAALNDGLGNRISTFTFDYSHWASHWATDAHIASCLADYISDVSTAYRSAGGDGKVLMVAHSMGGLAIRYALDARFAKHPVPAGTIAGVVSLSTPYGGSPFGGSAFARFKEVAGHYLGSADLPSAATGDGGACLAEHSGARPLPNSCGGVFAPYYPAGVTVTQIAGNVTIERKIFGFTAYSLPLGGDSIVPVPSSQGYLMSGPNAGTPRGQRTSTANDNCSIDQDVTRIVADANVISGLGKALAIEKLDSMTLDELNGNRLGPLEMAQDAFGLLGRCSHIHISTDAAAVQQVADALTMMLRALAVPAYRPYGNGRYDFSCDVPADWPPGREADNGDGLTVRNPAGTVTMLCYGANNDAASIADARSTALRYASADGDTVTYAPPPSATAFTLSGTTRAGLVFYQHTLWGPGSTVTLYWTYPPALRASLDGTVTHTVHALRAYGLAVSHPAGG
jgi:pimeloyl-ACP methyl ester carboxylesterase